SGHILHSNAHRTPQIYPLALHDALPIWTPSSPAALARSRPRARSGGTPSERFAMNLPDLLQQYGYAAVFVGTFVEGESMVVLGGYGAHRHYLRLEWVIAAAFAAAVVSDQLYYRLGRWQG